MVDNVDRWKEADVGKLKWPHLDGLRVHEQGLVLAKVWAHPRATSMKKNNNLLHSFRDGHGHLLRISIFYNNG